MIKVSELLSKRLIALSDAQVAGTVSNIIFNNKLTQGKMLKIYNDDGSAAETAYVDLKKVKCLSNDAVVVSDLLCIKNEWNASLDGILNPINSECFNQDGKSLGFVRDIIMDNLAVKSIMVDKKEFSPSQILSFSEKLLILNDSGKPIKLTKPKPIVPKTAPASMQVNIHSTSVFEKEDIALIEPKPNTAPKQNTAAPPQKPSVNNISQINSDVHLPHKVPPSGTVISTPPPQNGTQTPYNFLLGKTLFKEIRSDSGEIIATEKTVITPTVITNARNAGKLVQLALHAE